MDVKDEQLRELPELILLTYSNLAFQVRTYHQSFSG